MNYLIIIRYVYMQNLFVGIHYTITNNVQGKYRPGLNIIFIYINIVTVPMYKEEFRTLIQNLKLLPVIRLQV